MKNKILTTLVCLTALSPLFGQNASVTYDFKSDSCHTKRIPYGSLAFLEIQNINTLANSIQVSITEGNYTIPDGSPFGDLLSNPVGSIANGTNDLLDPILDILPIDVRDILNNPLGSILPFIPSEAEITSLNILPEDKDALLNLFSKYKNEKVEMFDTRMDKTDEALFKLFILHQKLMNLKAGRDALIRLANDPNLSFSQAQERVGKILVEYFDVLSSLKIIDAYQQELFLINASTITLKNTDSLRFILRLLATEEKAISVQEMRLEYVQIQELITKLTDTNTYIYHSNCLQAKKDFVKFDVQIKPNSSISNGKKRSFDYQTNVRGGLKFNFSTGLILSSLKDKSYTITPINDASSKIVENKQNGIANKQLSLAAMTHLSYRTGTWIAPAFTFGIGLDELVLPKAKIYLGLSALIGNEERMNVTAGWAFGGQDVLKSSLQLNREITNSLLPETIVERTMASSFFVGLSYNLNKNKAQ